MNDRYHDGHHHDAIHSAADGANAGQKTVNFRSLKGNRRSIEKNAQMPGNNVGQGKNDNPQQQVSQTFRSKFYH